MTNEILTRAAEVLERSVTLENQTLAAELRRFDTAQREALVRVEAEAGRLAEAGLAAHVKANTAQAQLAEAVGLLRKVVAWPAEECTYGQEQVQEAARAFLVRHDQVEQQEARAVLATQPAAGGPIHQWADQDLWMDGDEADMASARAEGFKTRTLWTAPPAAAHGDDAVRKDAERWRWLLREAVANCEEFRGTPFKGEAEMTAILDAAMRAQGDGHD